jgi:hypothetical protein
MTFRASLPYLEQQEAPDHIRLGSRVVQTHDARDRAELPRDDEERRIARGYGDRRDNLPFTSGCGTCRVLRVHSAACDEQPE